MRCVNARAGLMLVLLYGREGWFAPVIRASGYNVVFAFPGRALLLRPCSGPAECRPPHLLPGPGLAARSGRRCATASV